MFQKVLDFILYAFKLTSGYSTIQYLSDLKHSEDD